MPNNPFMTTQSFLELLEITANHRTSSIKNVEIPNLTQHSFKKYNQHVVNMLQSGINVFSQKIDVLRQQLQKRDADDNDSSLLVDIIKELIGKFIEFSIPGLTGVNDLFDKIQKNLKDNAMKHTKESFIIEIDDSVILKGKLVDALDQYVKS